MDFDAVRRTVEEVVAAMWATDTERRLFPRGWWPGSSCEHLALATAAVLEDRGFGQWTFVSAGRPDGTPEGHAWLELRDNDGAVLFSIDRTLHQFSQHAEPFVGEGRTPAADDFTVIRYEGIVWEWPWLGDKSSIFRRLIAAVREQLAAPRRENAK
jgi:hypothetical protein